ncbi:hypothetical protein GCM10022254_09280 [Actinomadura meridiana]|uniref:Transposase n=1 Tax=Actinomadura meridiana TaxID=559626 RepID=A0ABP8BTX5_9ACTN
MGKKKHFAVDVEARPRDVPDGVGRRGGTPKRKDRSGSKASRVPARKRKKKR